MIQDYENARTLFKGFDYQVIVRATIEGTAQGKIWVDEPKQPDCGFMETTEGWFLAGNPNKAEFNQGLKNHVNDMIVSGELLHGYLFFHIDSEEWKTQFPDIFDIRPPLPTQRIHFVCNEVALDWKNNIPKGYRLIQVDSTFDSGSLEFPEDIEERVVHQISTQIKRGFGMCLVDGNKVVVWIHSDCASGDECEIGIFTTEEYRLKGLGALTAAASVDHCLSIGYSSVGWHCEDHNYGSIGVAQKVGFVKERDYVHYICMVDEAVHFAEKGMRHFYDHEHDDAITEFERAFNLGEVPVWSYLLVARSYATKKEIVLALKNLEEALNLGWKNWEAVIKCEEIQSIIDSDEIKAFVKRVI
jgi:RimJ/RimL family protein N-acetyltransferase